MSYRQCCQSAEGVHILNQVFRAEIKHHPWTKHNSHKAAQTHNSHKAAQKVKWCGLRAQVFSKCMYNTVQKFGVTVFIYLFTC